MESRGVRAGAMKARGRSAARADANRARRGRERTVRVAALAAGALLASACAPADSGLPGVTSGGGASAGPPTRSPIELGAPNEAAGGHAAALDAASRFELGSAGALAGASSGPMRRFARAPAAEPLFAERSRHATAGAGGAGGAPAVESPLASFAGPVELTLPPVIHAIAGAVTSIHLDNAIFTESPSDYAFRVAAPIGRLEGRTFRIEPEPGDVGEHPLTVEVQGASGVVARASLVVRVAHPDAGAGAHLRILLVGDSLTAATHYPVELARLLAGPGNPTFRMLGTQVPSHAPSVHHEGRFGYSWKKFATHYEVRPDGTVYKSPFVRLIEGAPRLDLDAYFHDAGGELPDVVFVLLGVNDCFHADPASLAAVDACADEAFAHAEAILSALRDVRRGVFVGIGLTTPPNAREASFEAAYGGARSRREYHRIQHRLVQREIERFGGREAERIHLVPTELPIHTFDGFPPDDPVHPNPAGYAEIARTVYAFVKSTLPRPPTLGPAHSESTQE